MRNQNMTTSSPEIESNLANRLQQKYEYSRVLLELSQQQQGLIEQQDYDQLVPLLLQKQTLIEALQATSQTTPSLPELWKQHRDTLPPLLRQECESWLERSEQMLEELMSYEQACTSQLLRQREETQHFLAAASDSLQIQNAYEEFPTHSQFDINQ